MVNTGLIPSHNGVLGGDRPGGLSHRDFQELQARLAQVRMQHLAATAMLLVATAIFPKLGVYAVKRRVPPWLPALPIPIATAAALHYRRLGPARSRMRRLTGFYQRAIQRVKGLWAGEGFTGEEFDDANHLYARDPGIFGQGSLFELLCIARTAIGRRGLATYLLEAPALDETLARQEAYSFSWMRSSAEPIPATAMWPPKP